MVRVSFGVCHRWPWEYGRGHRNWDDRRVTMLEGSLLSLLDGSIFQDVTGIFLERTILRQVLRGWH